MKETLQEYCKHHDLLELLAQWHPLNNGTLTPADVSYGCNNKVWWKCANGHEWQATVFKRSVQRTGCPYCSRKLASPGKNDLESQMPELASQWHPTKNFGLTPDRVLPGSNRHVWWQCEKGHEWKACIKSRAEGTGCPVCANRKVIPGENDLATTDPLLAAQWHPMKNKEVSPADVSFGSKNKVWWQCEKGHEWKATIQSRASGVGCPVCSNKQIISGENDLASHYPQIAAQWLQDKNGNLRPDQVSASSNKAVWWQCEKGHCWKAHVVSRTIEHKGCPYCAGKRVWKGFNDLQTVEPLIASQWHPTLNEKLTPDMVTSGSRKKIWWQCADGHVWQAVIYSRTGKKKKGCPICSGNISKKRMQRYDALMDAPKK